MSVKPDPSGFPQRKVTEVRGVSAVQMRDVQRVAQEERTVQGSSPPT